DLLLTFLKSDHPNQRVILKAIALIKQNINLQISVIFIPDNHDPDEYVRDKGVESFQKLMNQTGESSTAFLLKFDRMGLNLANENDQLEYLKKALQRIGELNDALEQDL
ncbi:DNA primase, partial [Pediococcus acidilactici]|nr:DNA primase [Pediococcus acidilactici]